MMKKTKTLKAHLWLYFFTFALAIMIILWVLQILFLGAFFNSMKLNEMKNIGRLIEEQYDLNTEDFYDFWFEHSFESGMFATLVSENGKAVRNFNAFPRMDTGDGKNIPSAPEGYRRRNRGYIGEENFADFIQKVTSASGSVAYVDEVLDRGTSFAVYGSHLGKMDGENIYLFLMSPLERTDATRKVIETQLIIVSCISVLLALVLAYFIARSFSKPIENATASARKLAAGDYNVKFSKGSYKEIDELSDVLNHAANELNKTEDLRRDLISAVSHDLRTPLTIIKSYAELIRDISGSNEEKRLKHTGVIIDEANSLSLLVNDMLDLSKIQSGTAVMNIKEFDLKSLIESTVGRFEFFRENHGIQFEIDMFSDDCRVLGDESRIEQAVYNLLANAVNYTGDDKTVVISSFDSGDCVKVCVSDTGCGIDEKELNMIWDKYYTSHQKQRDEAAGTGLGLSIVKNIIIAHNSQFGVDSKPGKGTTFWFMLKKSS